MTVAQHRNGNVTFAVLLTDDGVERNDFSRNVSREVLFTLIVRPVNDPPSFLISANQTIDEHASPYAVSVPGTAVFNLWEGSFAGPPDETAQEVTFILEHYAGNKTLFADGPRVSPSGTLEYTAGAYQWGEALYRVYARDAGGASYGGNDNSTAHHLKITIRPRDDPPTIGLPGLQVA